MIEKYYRVLQETTTDYKVHYTSYLVSLYSHGMLQEVMTGWLRKARKFIESDGSQVYISSVPKKWENHENDRDD